MACQHHFEPCAITGYEVCRCGTYHSTQAIPPAELYGADYWSEAGGHPSLYEQAYNCDLHTENGISKSKFILDRLACDRDAALEIGCAPGRMLYWLKWAGRFPHIMGIDADPKYEDDIRAIGAYSGSLLFGLFPSVAPPNIREKWYTYVLASDVFEHSPEPEAFLTECHRLLKPGGQLFLMLPLADGLPADSRFFNSAEHVYLHSRANMQAMLADARFVEPVVDRWAVGHDTISVRKP